jgi:hypothetical protein
MKAIQKRDFERVLNALRSAYFSRESAEVGDMWLEARVMGHIRNLDPFYSRTGYFEVFQPFLWRLAPLACVLAVTLAVIMLNMDFLSDYELAKIIVSDPTDFIVLAMNN